ncbi:MAG: antibiotic biosynthesis monooxygenase [Alphaproteobacteria bacterium]|nr:antibiotic biosynthesis monooxygenase [Rhodospirillales bacterium]MCW9045623.1 antibiotic biosynthesis monooxygenase [Alphaproteobacteria bacterium]
MIGVIATITVKEGSESDFETVMLKLVKEVTANEPDCHLYALHKGDAPQTYVMMERYTNKEALGAHSSTPYFKSIGAEMMPFMAGKPEVRVLEEVS